MSRSKQRSYNLSSEGYIAITEAQQRPETRKKIGEGISRAFQKKTAAEKELINARKAVAYRLGNAERHAEYHGKWKTRAWVRVALDRLAKAEAAI